MLSITGWQHSPVYPPPPPYSYFPSPPSSPPPPSPLPLDAGVRLTPFRAAASLFAVVKAGEKALKRAAKTAPPNSDSDSNPNNEEEKGGAQRQSLLPHVDAKYLLSALDRMDLVFGVFYEPFGFEAADQKGGGSDEVLKAGELPEVMVELLARRLAARESKDWSTADNVREEIKALGYAVKVRGFAAKGACTCASMLVCVRMRLDKCVCVRD